MAETNSTENETPIADGERTLLALEATWEIEVLSKLIMEASENFDTTALIFRGLGSRIKDLNSVVMSAIDDEMCTNADLYQEIHKCRMPTAKGSNAVALANKREEISI